MSISTAFFVSPCLILFCIICSILVYVNGKTNKLKLKLKHLACSAGGFGGLSNVLPLFWIRCRLGELGRE